MRINYSSSALKLKEGSEYKLVYTVTQLLSCYIINF